MVNFENETTVSTPAGDIVKILLLQKREDLHNELEKFNKLKSLGTEPEQAVLKSKIGSLIIELLPYLKRKLKTEEYESKTEVLKKVFFNDEEIDSPIILEIIQDINKILDELRVTRIDTRVRYDRSNVEEDNKRQGYS